MRGTYRSILKKFFCRYIKHTRSRLDLTQSEMAEKLVMDDRSYIDLEHGKSCCSAVTLALFLIYVCDDIISFLEDLRIAFESEIDQAA